MENSGINKHFVSLIVMYFAWVGLCTTIVSLLIIQAKAQVDLGGDVDITSIVGIILASTFGFGVAGLGIVLSIIGLNLYKKKPDVAKGFGIANFVFILTGLGTMVAGSIMISIGFANIFECIE
ncbi:MAG: hypothetical protein Q6373_016775, partial [Candidatus Sigynarchaeota archaeon]